MGGCFSTQRSAQPNTRHKASRIFKPGGQGDAVKIVSSNVDVLPELTGGISRSKQSNDSGVASTSVECRSTGFPSVRYRPAPASLRWDGCLKYSGGQSRQACPSLQLVPTLICFLISAVHPTTAISVQSHQHLSCLLCSTATETTTCGVTHTM